MSAFLVVYAALFLALVFVLFYVSTRGTKPVDAVLPPVSAPPKQEEAVEAAEPAQKDAVTYAPGLDPKDVKEKWRVAHTDHSEVEAFAHTKALDENNKDPRLGSKLRAAKQRGTTVQATLATVQKMVLTTPFAPSQTQPAAGWESYLQEKQQDRLREKKGAFLRCTDGSYTSEYQKLLGSKPQRGKA